MIKNYTSDSKQTFDTIQKALISHRAKQIMFDYDDSGKVKSLAFALEINGSVHGFRLPARVDKVESIFLAEKKKKVRYEYLRQSTTLTDNEKAQAYRTAWANIRDWITAQLALIDTEQVKIEEVFLPYAVGRDGRTYFEAIQSNNFRLDSGPQEGEVING